MVPTRTHDIFQIKMSTLAANSKPTLSHWTQTILSPRNVQSAWEDGGGGINDGQVSHSVDFSVLC